ncbi:MAG: arginine--tRNA ligase, partial [Planctomycetota bacterium]
MKTAIDILEERISGAMARVTGEEDCAAIVRPTADAKFGDYQANGIMALAKRLKKNPRQLAEQVVEQLDVSDLCEGPEIAGPGFINLRLKPDYVAEQLLRINADESQRLGIAKEDASQTVVVDFSSPNVAKEMHVGHLRSTIIGDAICRIVEFLGHDVIRQNHIGDWGTQFGMLINYMLHVHTASRIEKVSGTRPEDAFALEDMEHLYRRAKQEFDSDPEFAERSRRYVVDLQKGVQNVVRQWREIVDLSMDECQEVYDRLRVTLKREHVCGESFYNDKLPAVVRDLEEMKLARPSDDAMCVFPEGFKNKEGQALPFIVQKSDGAYLYATT